MCTHHCGGPVNWAKTKLLYGGISKYQCQHVFSLGPWEKNPPTSCLGRILLAVRIMVAELEEGSVDLLPTFHLVSHSDPFCVCWPQVQSSSRLTSQGKNPQPLAEWRVTHLIVQHTGGGAAKGLNAPSIDNPSSAPVFSPTPHPCSACYSPSNCFSSSKYVLISLKEHKLRHKRWSNLPKVTRPVSSRAGI